jgi:hypothetical protein
MRSGNAGVRLIEFSFCGKKSPDMVYSLAAKIEFCKPDPKACVLALKWIPFYVDSCLWQLSKQPRL